MVGKFERECSVSLGAVTFVYVASVCVKLFYRYELLAQNGFTKLPNSLKIDDGYYGEGFYFTRSPRYLMHPCFVSGKNEMLCCCRYSDYYNCGFSLATRQVEGSFLMSFTLMGRPYPVTQHPEDVESGLKGRACREEPHRCCGPDSHDSHYVTVRKKGEYYPCPPREQPDFDEVVVFNPACVLPAAAFEFKRRRRTLLWLDDRPDRNKRVLMEYPGCPQQPHQLAEAAYPMRRHCSRCMHGLTLDSNPFGTCKERRKAAQAAGAAYSAAVKAAEDCPSAEAALREEECRALAEAANALVAEAQAAADVVKGELRGRDVKLKSW
jgi:hypothetical protein